jgi:hypothetical protein
MIVAGATIEMLNENWVAALHWVFGQFQLTFIHIFQSEIDRIEVEKVEQERLTYAEALVAARENPSEELFNLVAEARSRLQVLVL